MTKFEPVSNRVMRTQIECKSNFKLKNHAKIILKSIGKIM